MKKVDFLMDTNPVFEMSVSLNGIVDSDSLECSYYKNAGGYTPSANGRNYP